METKRGNTGKGKAGVKSTLAPEPDVLNEVLEMERPYSIKVRNLREKRYVVRPIRRKGQWVTSDHDSSFMNDGAKIGIVVPVLKGNILANPMPEFTKEDVVLLAEELGLEDIKKLNLYTPKCFWRGKTVTLDRNGLHLHLDRIEDLINFLVLRSDTDRIAPNWSSRFDRGTYKFALVEEGEELLDDVSNLEEKKNAYILFGKMDSSLDKMKDFLYVYYLTKKDAKQPPRNATLDQLRKAIGQIIEDDLKTYLSILNDDFYTLKLLIQKSIANGSLQRNRHLYSLPGSDHPIGTIEDLIDFLDDPKNQDVRMKLKHQIENVE
ncbi:MAG: hypothetical protein UR43_C0022G0010 [candidate division TM6 bacterium GW2011_GWF2_33_332]|nr:MAG: hypothetical protein UR43_C0022G0010 [candidate division TM6 bacterium GW2011_GWF2_33_332]